MILSSLINSAIQLINLMICSGCGRILERLVFARLNFRSDLSQIIVSLVSSESLVDGCGTGVSDLGLGGGGVSDTGSGTADGRELAYGLLVVFNWRGIDNRIYSVHL